MTDSYNDNLHRSAIGKLYEFGRDLRRTSTEAEKILWVQLRNRKLNGLKFRRQHPLDKFVADFYCHEKRLVVELDGTVHDDKEVKEYDETRTYILNELGITVMRFRNGEVINDTQRVLSTIAEFLA